MSKELPVCEYIIPDYVWRDRYIRVPRLAKLSAASCEVMPKILDGLTDDSFLILVARDTWRHEVYIPDYGKVVLIRQTKPPAES